MPPLGPIKGKDLIYYLRRLGFEDPYAGRRDQFMIRGTTTLWRDHSKPGAGELVAFCGDKWQGF